MNHSGDAAEQIVRMSLEGVEVAARITGTAAKEIAVLLAAALKNKNSTLKLKGKARLTSMLKSGKALEIYSVKESDLQKFMQGAKEYGIVYCVLRNAKSNPDGLCDIMVKADDAPKISRLSERFKFATVDKAKIESEIVASRAEKAADARTEKAPRAEPQATVTPDAPDMNDTEKLLDELLSTDEGKSAPDTLKPEKTEPMKTDKETVNSRPLADAPPMRSNPSAPISESRSNSAETTMSKPSVKDELREIRAARKEKEADTRGRDDKASGKPRTNQSTTHKQPQSGKKSKSKKPKER